MSFCVLEQCPWPCIVGLLHHIGAHWVSLEVRQLPVRNNPACQFMETVSRDNREPLS